MSYFDQLLTQAEANDKKNGATDATASVAPQKAPSAESADVNFNQLMKQAQANDLATQSAAQQTPTQQPAPTFAERIKNFVTGAVKSYGGQMAGTAGAFAQTVNEGSSVKQQIGTDLKKDGALKTVLSLFASGGGGDATVPMAQTAQLSGGSLDDTVQAVKETGRKLSVSAAQEINRASEGLGTVGRTLVNAGVAGVQMGADVAASVLSGGSSMLPMVLRSFGSGVQDAEAKGYSYGQAMSIGLATAATEYFTERLFSGNPAYDSGDGIVKELVKKISSNKRLIAAMSSLPAEILTEGLEEVIADVLEPAAEWAITGNRPEYELDQIIEDGVVGIILGGIGQGGAAVRNAARRTNAQQDAQNPVPAAADARQTASEGNLTPADIVALTGQQTGNTAGQSTVNENGLAALTIQERINLASGKRNKVISTFSDAVDFIRNALANRQSSDRAYMGKITDATAAKVLAETGVDVKGYNAILPSDNVRHIMKNHGDAQSEAARGQIAVAPEDIALIPEVLTAPDAVRLSNDTDSRGRPVLVFEKQIGDNFVTMQAVADGTHSLQTDTLYKKKRKNPQGTEYYNAGETTDPAHNVRNVPPQGSFNFESTITQPSNVVKGGEQESHTAGSAQSADDSLGSARGGFDPYSAAENRYGTQDGGVNAVRPDDVPISTNGKDRVSRSVVSAKGAAVTPDSFAPLIENYTMKGKFSFIPITNNATTAQAQSAIMRNGWEESLRSWTADVRAGKTGPLNTAIGALLYNNVVNSGNEALALDILSDFQSYATNTAQALQAMRILKTLTPSDRLYMIERQLTRYNEQEAVRRNATNRRRGISETDNVPISEWMRRVGEDLAGKLERATKVKKPRAKTVSQTVLSDLINFYRKDGHPGAAQVADSTSRAEIDRIRDLFQNHDKYQEAWDSARAALAAEFGEDSEAMTAFDEWIRQAPDYTSRLSRMLVGEGSVTISQDLAERYLNAETDVERDAVISEMQREVADQLPSTPLDKWTALRYTNMLGNFKTQIRNVGGNAITQALYRAKDTVKTGLEGIAYLSSGGTYERQTALNPGKARIDAARADFANVERIALGEGKYSLTEGSNTSDFMRGAEGMKTVFKLGDNAVTRALGIEGNKGGVVYRTLEAYRKATNWAMEKGDVVFSRANYARALAGYLKAHSVTAEQFESEAWRKSNADFLDSARAYAIRQAQEATFRDTNAVSKWAGSFLRGRDTPAAIRLLGEGLQPFRKTPANVAVRMEEFSPLGLINTAYKAAQAANPNSSVTGADVIDQLAKALTGTGIFALGMWLRAAGKLRGGDDEDDNQAYFDDLNGRQNWALELRNDAGELISYTLDWATPIVGSLFMGAEMYDAIAEGGFNFADLERTLSQINDPMIEMSMLSGVRDTLDEFKYSDDSFGQMLASLAISYATQGLTNTLLGQLERISETDRKSTFIDKTSAAPVWLQRALGKASAKTPRWDYRQYDYVNAYGETESSGSLAERIVTNLFSPGYLSKVDESKLATELQRVADATGDTTFFPDNAPRYINDGGTRYLSQSEYEKYAQTRGREFVRMANAVINGRRYVQLTDEEKADIFSGISTYAGAKAKQSVTHSTAALTGEARTVEKAAEAQSLGIDPSEYFVLKVVHDEINNGNSTAAQKATKFAQYLSRQPWLNDTKREAIQELLTYSSGFRAEANDKALAAEQYGVSVDEFYKAKAAMDADGNGSLKKDEVVAYLNANYPADKRRALFELYGGGNWKNPY
ncbi:MAG: hypothetical protein IJU66_09365 [Oscillospiraceae bacterium]|nr:hypothetical protein [Oscillospiraceae bacterium]